MVAKAMLLTSNRGFAEWGEVFGSSPSAPLHPRYRIQIYSVMSKIIHLTSGEVTLQINQGCYATLGGVKPRLSGEAWAGE